jgi:hypothetical protein
MTLGSNGSGTTLNASGPTVTLAAPARGMLDVPTTRTPEGASETGVPASVVPGPLGKRVALPMTKAVGRGEMEAPKALKMRPPRLTVATAVFGGWAELLAPGSMEGAVTGLSINSVWVIGDQTVCEGTPRDPWLAGIAES